MSKAKRMYSLVLYSLSPMQKGIQAGHAVEQYAAKYRDDEEYVDYVHNHMTWVVLDGGTTNDSYVKGQRGSLNATEDLLKKHGIKYAYFREPDLGDQLTALCFICDEDVFDAPKADYSLLKDINLEALDLSTPVLTEEDKALVTPTHHALVSDWKFRTVNVIGWEAELKQRILDGKPLAR